MWLGLFARRHLCRRQNFLLAAWKAKGVSSFPRNMSERSISAKGEVAFHVTSSGDANEVKYTFGDGAGTERPTYDPRLLGTIDKKLNEASEGWMCGAELLRLALEMSAPFLARETEVSSEQHKIVRMFAEDGVLQVTNAPSSTRFYFYCEAFLGHALQIGREHLGVIDKFPSRGAALASRCGPART